MGGASLTAEFDLDWATLTSITAARDLINDSGIDADSGPLPLLGIVLDSETASFQQEIHLASNETDPFGWQTGVFFLRSTAELTGTTTSGLLIEHHPQFSQLPFPVTGFADFVEQTIDAFEAGFKAELLDNRLSLNAAAFHYDIDDYQVRAVGAQPGRQATLCTEYRSADGRLGSAGGTAHLWRQPELQLLRPESVQRV